MIFPTTDRVPSGKQITAGDVSLWRVAPASRRLYGGHLARCFGAANMPARCRRYPINDLPGQFPSHFPACFFSTFAHVSFNATVRLKTGLPGVVPGSTQK